MAACKVERPRYLLETGRFAWRCGRACEVRFPRHHETQRHNQASLCGPKRDETRPPGVSRTSRFEAGPPRHVVPSWPAKSSRRHHEEIVKFRNHLTVIEPIGDYPESQGLGFCNCSLAGFAVTHDSRQIENVCEPPAVVFLFNFYPHGPAPQIAGLRIGFPPQPSLASLDLWKVDSWVTTPNPRLVATAGRQSFIRTSNRKREPPGFRGQDASGYLRRRATAARPRPPTARA